MFGPARWIAYLTPPNTFWVKLKPSTFILYNNLFFSTSQTETVEEPIEEDAEAKEEPEKEAAEDEAEVEEEEEDSKEKPKTKKVGHLF